MVSKYDHHSPKAAVDIQEPQIDLDIKVSDLKASANDSLNLKLDEAKIS